MMHCTRMLTLKKTLLSSTMKYIMERQCIITNGIAFSITPQFHKFCDDARSKALSESVIKVQQQDGLLFRLLSKVGLHKEKYQSVAVGYLIYENLVDELQYSKFFNDFNMADTFFSWFLVTELHIWMLLVRYMAEGKDGKLVRIYLVEALWKDVENRIKALGAIHPKIKKKQLSTLSAQFNAAVIGYDEGILSEDRVLAGALWRRFFCLECNNPEHIEKLLIYVRKQTYLLDKIPAHEILRSTKVNWIDLSNIR
ncbi:ubiquinol-cytochrome-c reductase complex assembly factor 1 isoform X1 [Hylaeus volcanicus]|uniref:ubiquinol-cytochrome-c reductase complex assembly factor 1 isoform X1 n=1 Tax=Hylaeus volcanicus TaxID=313075 RepID=UPI0023B7CCE6|nr:ubiquinol-cytochrome-c reductase complex assembly factor 1 isoform X1 [Hylaeus volcanicus]